MKGPRRPRRRAAGASAALLLVAAVVVAVLILLYRPLPTIDADARLLGLEQRGEIVRDARGIPHIFARTTHDLFYLQGYVVAQDRLFQLDLLRRAGRGQLAALIGPAGADSDAFALAGGIADAAGADGDRLGAAARSAAQAYADGVNKFLEQHGESLPLEFTLLGFRPARWTVADTLVVQRVLAEARGAGSGLGRFVAGPGTDSGASCVARSGPGTGSGRPTLEGDPRLAGQRDPPLWYAVALRGPDDELAGFAAPGVPGIAIGHNRRVAWSYVSAAGTALLRDLDAALAIGRTGDAAAFGAAVVAARGGTPAYCYADAAGHVGAAAGGRVSLDPPGGVVRQVRDPGTSAVTGTVLFRHPLDGLLPAGLGRLLSAGPYDPPAGGALERIVVDLGDPDAARAVLPIGESGQPAGRHHGDQTGPWRAGELPPLPLARSRLGPGEGTLVFRPR